MARRKTPPKAAATPPDDSPAPQTPTVSSPPVEDRADTHTFTFSQAATYATCACGAERDMKVVGGKVVRVYRAVPTVEWAAGIGVCPKYVVPVAPVEECDPPSEPEPEVVLMPGLDFNEPRIPEDDYAAPAPGKPLLEEPPGEMIGGAKLADYIEMVDLDIAYSPVLPLPGEDKPPNVYGPAIHRYNIPVDVITDGERYMLEPKDRLGNPTLALAFPLAFASGNLSADRIREMRARYLLQRGVWAKKLHTLPNGERRDIVRAFDLQAVAAMGDSPLAKLLRGEKPSAAPGAP